MKRLFVLGVIVGGLMCLPSVASAEDYWFDNFDNYVSGSMVNGQGGWEWWATGADAQISNGTTEPAQSAPNSIKIMGSTDIVHQYSGNTSGDWIYTAWMYIDEGYSGPPPDCAYFIMLNTYAFPSGPYFWSVQMGFDSNTGLVFCDAGSSNQVKQHAFLKDQWAEIRVEIYLDQDWTKVYYNGFLQDDQLLPDHPVLGGGYAWTKGVFGGDNGAKNIGCVDLYNQNATDVFFDDISLVKMDALVPNVNSISTSAGGTVNFQLNAGASNANRGYLIFGSLSGDMPGLPLKSKGTYNALLRVNFDFLTDVLIGLAGTPIAPGFIGNLDGFGNGSASFILPPASGLPSGVSLTFCYPLKNWSPGKAYVSNVAVINVVP
jgi:hypothetical protein